MKEVGEVINVEGSKAVLGFPRNSACGKCGACSMGKQNNTMVVEVNNILNASIGDIVEVDMEPEKLLQASLIIYIFPLLSLILGIIVGYNMVPLFHLKGSSEIYGALVGILFTILSFMIIRWLEPVWQKESRFSPKMISFIAKKEN